MALTVTTVLDEARALLNDLQVAGGTLFQDATLLPYFKKAYQELENKFVAEGVAILNEISSPLTITAGSTDWAAQPTNIIIPIFMEERSVGATVPYTPMKQAQWEPNESQGQWLEVWTWREGAIKFRGATTDRSVRLRYVRRLTPDSESVVVSTDLLAAGLASAKTYLAARTAAIAAFAIGGNASRAQAFAEDAKDALAELVATETKGRQGMPVRRKPWRAWR